MKYVKLFEQHENIDTTGLIRAWLSALGVEEDKFVINPDWSISTDCAIEIPPGFLTKIPVKFKELNIEDAYFMCEDNNLKTLENLPMEGPDVEITYNGNPCSNDPIQLKWLNPVWMSKGIIWNQKDRSFENDQKIGPYQFVFPLDVMDAYWDDILKKQPELFKNLEVCSNKISLKSNHISKRLYKKYQHLTRAKETGLLDMNI